MRKNSKIVKYKKNLIIIGIAVLLIIVGNILMISKTNSTPDYFDTNVFNFRALFIAPVIIISGFILFIIGIMVKPKLQNAR